MSWTLAAIVGGSALSGLGARRRAKKADRELSNMQNQLLRGKTEALGMLDQYRLSSTQLGQNYMDAARGIFNQQMGWLSSIHNQSMSSIREFQKIADEFAAVGKKRFDRYVSMFDPLEEKLHDYYMNLDPDELAARGNQTAQEQYQLAMEQVNADLAARGLLDSGIQGQMNQELAFKMAETKAENILNAPHQVAELQSGWLDYGKTAQDNAWNMYGTGVGMQRDYTNMMVNAYGNYMLAGSNAYANYGSMLGGAYSALMGSNDSYYQGYLNTINNYNQGMANLYGQKANLQAQQSQGYMNLAGNLLGTGLGLWYLGGLKGGGSLLGKGAGNKLMSPPNPLNAPNSW
jgi:hypothetical protein